jgi:glycosyltransferase involved in cell wall biosynthesis
VYSSGDAVVTLDADLQDPPELIELMLKKSKEGVDIVYAARRERDSDSFFKKNTARFFYRAMQLMGAVIVYDHADYRLISRKVVKTFKEFKEVNIFLRGLFPSMGFSHETIYYDRQERAAGRSKYPFWKMLSFAWEGITSFSIAPLRLASISGFIVFLTSLVCIVWALYTKMRGMTVPGWTSIVIPMFFIGGLNMLFWVL